MSKVKLALETLKNIISELRDTGELLASKELTEKRLEICSKCPHNKGTRCEKCGCVIGIKANVKAANCPVNYWDEKIIEEFMTGSIDPIYERNCCE